MGVLELLIILLIICALVGSFPGFGWSWTANAGYGPFGAIVFVILIIVLLRVLHVV